MTSLTTHARVLLSALAVVTVCAAMFAGFVTSFLVTPIERVKIILQAKKPGDKGTDEVGVIKNMLSQVSELDEIMKL